MAAWVAGGEAAVAAPLSALSQNSLVVFGDWTAGSDVAGRVTVGGNVLGNATDIAVGAGLGITPGEVVFTVGGNVANNVDQLQVGSALIGGNLAGTNINLNQAGNNVSLGGSVMGGSNVNNGTLIQNTGFIPDISALETQLKNESAAFAALTPNSSLDVPNANTVILDAMPSGPNNQAVFDLTFAELFGNTNASLMLALNGADEIIVNVSGGGTVLNNMTSGFSSASAAVWSSIVWNFYDAASLDLDRQFFGSVLAPYAAVSNGNSIEGSVAAESFTQGGEIHLPLSTVEDPTVPEPSSALLCLLLAAVGTLLRRRAVA